jgi:hypothetical protein
MFPVSLVMARYDSVIEPTEESFILTIYLHFTFLAKFAEKSRQKVVAHMREELKASKRLIEGWMPVLLLLYAAPARGEESLVNHKYGCKGREKPVLAVIPIIGYHDQLVLLRVPQKQPEHLLVAASKTF